MQFTRVLIGLLVLAFSLPMPVEAQKIKNKRREAQKEAALDAQAQEIEIFLNKPDRPYKILAIVKADDILTKKRDAIYHTMRRKALEHGADAITEVQCESVAKYLAQTCMGYAVKWTD